MKRFFEPSSFAGYGIIFYAIPELIASHGASPTAWAQVLTGLAAILKTESSAVKA